MSRFARTPPKLANEYLREESAVTPGPSRVRINQLHGQVSELVRKNQTLDRKIVSETTRYKLALQIKDDEIKAIKDASKAAQKELEWSKRELEHCISEGSAMRDEIRLHSVIQQQKALIVLAQEQMRVVEIEGQLLETDRARVLRDHKISLFQVREEELLADLEQRDAQIADLEGELSQASSSLEHERNAAQAATSTQASSSNKELRQAQAEVSSARSEVAVLQAKVESLESKARALKASEKEARSELENWLREEGSASSKQKETQLRTLKSDLEKRQEEVEELKEDLREAKKDSKDREKLLKSKLKEAQEEAERLQEELEESRASTSKSEPRNKDKTRKASQAGSEDEDESPKKKAKKAVSTAQSRTKSKAAPEPSPASDSEADAPPTKKTKAPPKTKIMPLEESDTDNKALSKKAKESKKDEADEENVADISKDGDEKKKKKKRTLGVQAKPSFSWDHIMDSGDGVIPSYLSPVKGGGKPTGTIPRMGLSIPNRANRFG
ncbi:hypothetical protein IAR50_004125 [Cryptococcus sp. DSM 104548]